MDGENMPKALLGFLITKLIFGMLSSKKWVNSKDVAAFRHNKKIFFKEVRSVCEWGRAL